jgi:hypothetical protein
MDGEASGMQRSAWVTPRLERTSVTMTRVGLPDEVNDYTGVNGTEQGPSPV